MNVKILVLSLLAVFTISCSSDDNNDNPLSENQLSTSDLDQAQNLKLVSVTSSTSIDYDNDGTSSTDVFSQMNDCEKNRILSFTKTTVNFQVPSCEIKEGSYNWSVNGYNDKKISINSLENGQYENVEEWSNVEVHGYKSGNTTKITSLKYLVIDGKFPGLTYIFKAQ